MTKYLTVEDVEKIHDAILQRYRGLYGVRDRGLLLSALEAPKAAFGGIEMYPTLLPKAAMYLFHVIKNHAFNDGNKRTGVALALLFLKENEIRLSLTIDELEDLAVRVADGQMTKADVLAFFESMQVSLSLP